MGNDTPLPHLLQANSWKRLFNERLQQFSDWDDHYQILNTTFQSALYKARQQLRSDTFHAANVNSAYDMVLVTRENLIQRVADCQAEVAALQHQAPQEVSGALQQLYDNIRSLREQHNKQIRSLDTSRKLLQSQGSALLAPISGGVLQQQVDQLQQGLMQSWTGLPMARLIDSFFEDIDNNMLHIEREIERVNGLLSSIYQRPEHNLNSSDLASSKLLSIAAQRNQLNALRKKAADYRSPLRNLFTRKSVLFDNFIHAVVMDIRNIYIQLNHHVDDWVRGALVPLVENNKYQKQMIDAQLQRVNELENAGALNTEDTAKLQANIEQLQAALKSLEPLYQDILRAKQTAEAKTARAEAHSGQVVSINEMRKTTTAN